ncbi:MAG: hypothetical protein GWN00_31025, partial [Aliifodinibius sp.]|nr:Ig-like domain-containing protein [Fodinibius sp.]NIW48162.1 hypothetical protein [Gammaproteobacteria bacterium]NIX58678.1 hypothetical protein [candidate division Zixibacteria bacterium]NIY29059.1 hypothetical protein [Fodinibius sp.]
AYLAGITYSADFPTQNPHDSVLSGLYDCFIAKLSALAEPQIYSVYPNQNAVNVPPNTEITATFTVPMDSSTFNIAVHGVSIYGSISGWHSMDFSYHNPTLTAT